MSDSRSNEVTGHLGSGLGAIVGLSSLAFAQPIYDLLRRSPEFFAIRGLSAGDLALLIVVLAIGPAVVLAAPALLARLLRPGWVAPSTAAIGGLSAVICLQALRALPLAAAVSLAGLAGICAGWAWLRFPAARSFGMLLSAAALVVPALLVLSPGVRASVATADMGDLPKADDTGARAPVILVVFDEWSLTSVLDRNGDIDRRRLPNLAALADRATWYPNATAAADVTALALPAMLTGANANASSIPTFDHHPVNLFTVLAPSHDLHAVEPITSLCPPDLNLFAAEEASAGERLGLLASDLWIVWLATTLPSPWADELPDATRTWSGFGRKTLEIRDRPPTGTAFQRALVQLRSTDRAAEFRDFVQAIEAPGRRPAFHFLHSMLPHLPWEYLPSGRRYNRPRSGVHGLVRETWSEHAWSALHHRKRYLLQVEFVDRLLGELVARLEATNMFDRSVIAITADHGIAFQPGESRRVVEPEHSSPGQLLDLASVPLLVKAPYQEAAVTDERPISLVELPALVLDAAGGSLERSGLPLPGESPTAQPVIVGKHSGAVLVPAMRDDWRASRMAKLAEILGEASDPMAIGAVSDLHGRRLTDLDIRPGDATVGLVSPGAWNDMDPSGPVIPAIVDGVFGEDTQVMDRAVAVAVEGVIGATVETHTTADGRHRFVALLPEGLFRDGLNRIDVLLVSGEPGDLTLEHVTRPASSPIWSLSQDAEGRVDAIVRRSASVRGERDQRFPVVAQQATGLVGFLNGGYSLHGGLNGWVVDREQPGSVDVVVGFLGDTFLGPVPIALDRADVARRYSIDHLHSGFLLRPTALADRRNPDHLPAEEIEDRIRREGVAVYALSRRGQAIRLRHAWRALTLEDDGTEVLPITDGRRLPVHSAGHGFGGQVDLVTSRDGQTFVEGWAGDLETGEPPGRIVIYRDGEFLAGNDSGRPRPDVADAHQDSGLLRTGFRIRVPGAPAPKAFADRHRVFALMKRSVAVELPMPGQP